MCIISTRIDSDYNKFSRYTSVFHSIARFVIVDITYFSCKTCIPDLPINKINHSSMIPHEIIAKNVFSSTTLLMKWPILLCLQEGCKMHLCTCES